MNLKECYTAFGGDYTDVTGRLGSERLVSKFVVRFLSDSSFSDLEKELGENNYEDAFRAAHTLKGVCQNLGITKLYEASRDVTEALREKNYAKANELMPAVTVSYRQTTAAIETYKADNGL
jgi:HPt (histidine-containing phosphotransfer) domain-containing protein